jgi:3-hydroxybutyryl-CoA dehydrogenase
MQLQDIKRVLVIGAGTMGEGIAQNFAQSGLRVLLVDTDKKALSRCHGQIEANLALFQEFNLLSEDPSLVSTRIDSLVLESPNAIDDIMGRIDFVVEAVPEVLALKRELFSRLDASREDIVLASNTSSLTITKITEGLRAPGRVVGLHYFYPAHIIPLVEIHRGKDTTEETVTTARNLMLKVGKRPILVRKEIPGFIVNRIQAAYNREVTYLLEEGVATAEDLDLAAKASYGFRLACLGPLEIHDLNGLDTVLRSGEKTRKSICNATEPSAYLVEKVEKGELGVKTGKGWHDYAGRSREEILDQSNRKLLQQLILFHRLEKVEK